MPEQEDAIRSLLLPLEDDNLLLPGTVVAEVVGYVPPEPAGNGSPDWLLGSIDWRGQRVPCVAFESLGGQSVPEGAGARARLVVLKAVGEDPTMPYIAVRTRSIPRLINVEREGLEIRDEEMPPQGIQQAVLAHGEPALIPDLAAVEGWVRDALRH